MAPGAQRCLAYLVPSQDFEGGNDLVGCVCVGSFPGHEVNEGLESHEAAVVGVDDAHDAVELSIPLRGRSGAGDRQHLSRAGWLGWGSRTELGGQGPTPVHTPSWQPASKGLDSPGNCPMNTLSSSPPTFLGSGEWGIEQIGLLLLSPKLTS